MLEGRCTLQRHRKVDIVRVYERKCEWGSEYICLGSSEGPKPYNGGDFDELQLLRRMNAHIKWKNEGFYSPTHLCC